MWRRYGDDPFRLLVFALFSLEVLSLGFVTWRFTGYLFSSVPFALLFIALSILYGMLLSQMAVGIETLLLSRYPRLRDRAVLVAAAFFEFFGYRQILTWERFVATFQIGTKRGKWGDMPRVRIAQEDRREQAPQAATPA